MLISTAQCSHLNLEPQSTHEITWLSKSKSWMKNITYFLFSSSFKGFVFRKICSLRLWAIASESTCNMGHRKKQRIFFSFFLHRNCSLWYYTPSVHQQKGMLNSSGSLKEAGVKAEEELTRVTLHLQERGNSGSTLGGMKSTNQCWDVQSSFKIEIINNN